MSFAFEDFDDALEVFFRDFPVSLLYLLMEYSTVGLVLRKIDQDAESVAAFLLKPS